MWIDINAVKNATNAEKIDGKTLIVLFSIIYKSISERLKEANIIGIESNIENIAAESLFIDKNLAPVIVTPALLAPGIKAKLCQSPIINTSKKFNCSQDLCEFIFLSAINKMIAKIILDHAITIKFLKYN